jgi:hypothetical protein
MAKSESKTERCPRCHAEEYAVSTEPTKHRTCLNRDCRHIWMPKSIMEIKYDDLKYQFERLEIQNEKLMRLKKRTRSMVEELKLAKNLNKVTSIINEFVLEE